LIAAMSPPLHLRVVVLGSRLFRVSVLASQRLRNALNFILEVRGSCDSPSLDGGILLRPCSRFAGRSFFSSNKILYAQRTRDVLPRPAFDKPRMQSVHVENNRL